MKKILFLVLLTLIICELPNNDNNKEVEVILKGIDYQTIETIWNSIKEYVEKAVQFLKQIGLYDKIIEILKTYGRQFGINYCTSFAIPEPVCTSIIDFLLQFLK